MNRLKYILIITLLAITTLVAAQDPYVIDSVCVGADRDYRIDGETRLDSFAWHITDTFGFPLANPAYIDFDTINNLGDSIWGSEINYTWNDVGEFEILTLHYSEHGCDTFELGRVKVFNPPVVFAGDDMFVCSIDTVQLYQTTAQYYSALQWTTLGDGSFVSDTLLRPKYIPGINDNIAGNTILIITADGLAENETCTPAIDTIEIWFTNPEVTFVPEHLLCFNDSSGLVKAIVSKGSEPFNYLWSGPNGYSSDKDSIFGLAAGKYIVTITDSIGCAVTDSVEITQPELLTVITAQQNVSCFGGNDGMASAVATGGTGGPENYIFEWNTLPPQDSSEALDLFAGEYIVKVTDINGCEAFDTITILEPPLLVLSADSIDATCIGGSLGSIDLTVTGGTPFFAEPYYIYEWSDNSGVIATTEDIVDLEGNKLYTVIVIDSLGCTDTLEIYVNEDNDIELALESIDSILCFNEPTGAINIAVTGGTEPITYLWDTGETTENLVNIMAGFYHVVVTDANSCKEEMSFTLINPDELLANITPDTSYICIEESITFSGNPEGGTGLYIKHQWEGNGANYLNATDITDPLFSGAPAGAYILIYIVTDENYCVTRDTMYLDVMPETYYTVYDSICESDLPHTWNDSLYLAAGTYENTIPNTFGCDSIITYNLFVYDVVTLTATPHNTGAFGELTGSIDLKVEGGTLPYTFEWDNGENTKDISGLAAGIYVVTVTDANGCIYSLEVTITGEPAEIYMDCPDMITVGCYGDIEKNPPYSTYLEYANAGGTATSDYGIDTLQDIIFVEEILDSTFCFTLLRTYTIKDSIGNDIYCEQLLVVDDTEDPGMPDIPSITLVNETTPLPITIYSEFSLAYGDATDNCEIIESTFRFVSDTPDGNTSPSTITRLYEIADYCGNIGYAEQKIIIYDDSEIFIDCPPIITFQCPEDVPDEIKTLKEFKDKGGSVGSHIDFPIIESTFSYEGVVSVGNNCPTTITRTYSIKNTNGDSVTCERTIIVKDTKDPIFRLNNREIYSCFNIPKRYTTVAEGEKYGTLYDNCGVKKLEILSSTPSGRCPETITRIYRATDFCDNYTDATQIIVVRDTTPPEFYKGIENIVADCILPDTLKDYSAFVGKGGEYIEWCGGIRMTHITDTLANPTISGVYNRVYRFFDDCDNYVDYEQKITLDVEVPVFTQLRPFCQNTVADLLPTSSINGITGTWNPAIIETSVAGISTYTFTPYAGQCAAEVTMDIEVTPEIELYETHVNLGFSINPIGSIILTVTGGTEPFTIEWENGETSTEINNLAAGDYTVNVTDAIGCEATLTITITGDIAELDIYCPPDITVECIGDVPPNYEYYSQFVNGGGSAYSDCGIDTSTFVFVKDSSDLNSCPETIYRMYQISDNCGNTEMCTHLIIVNDVTPPEIVCPPDDAAECLSDLIHDFETIEEFIAAGGSVSDNCALDSATFAFITTIEKTINSTVMTTVYSIKDLCGNENSCEHKFILTDTIPPTAICNSITVYLDESGNYILTEIEIQNISAGSNDNCTAEEDLIIDVDIVEFDCDDVEEGVQVIVVVTDEAGNVSENCTAIITVVDSVPPVALCRDIIIYLDEYGLATINVSNIDDGSYDNCMLDTMFINKDTFDCTNVGDNPVQLTVIDAATNRNSCIANVIVVDTIPPDVLARDVTIQLDANAQYILTTTELVIGAAYDICGVDTVFLDQYILDCDNIGTTYIVVTAIDVNGNVGRDTAALTVYGNTPPNVLPDSGVTVMNIPIEINIVSNDYDLKTEIDLSTLFVIKQPVNGIVALQINQTINKYTGFITYTPEQDFVGIDTLTYSICDDAIPCVPMCGTAQVYITVLKPNNPPTAVDDYFTTTCASPTGNIIDNDYDIDGDEIKVFITPVQMPDHGQVTIYDNGDFDYTPDIDYIGLDSFLYEITDLGLPNMRDTATVYIEVEPDNDCDGVPDWDDIDDDNDGILDVVEGLIDFDGDGLSDNGNEIDSDLDGIPDYLDIDSDNDGIVDNEEGQAEGNYIYPTGSDLNNNGWDDAYDPEDGGYEFEPADTDGDSVPDYLDLDSENDHVYDFIEGHDINADGIPDVTRIFVDSDRDGLDDIYDTVFGWNDPNDPFNSLGSNSPLQDFDGDGTRDWRDTNDEDDEYMTIDEDINNDGDYSNDDLDLDGYPEYLDKTLDCELFVPEGFSPNGDGVHDFFQVLCIQRYPNAIMMIFNRNGDKLFEKDHYGNLDFWGSNEDAWWWGTSENKWTIFNTGGLPAGNYVYVLQLGNGKILKGTVMVNY